jgi:hypothetical protein
MNTQEQAYIEGFVKRANEYGFNDEEAFEILKEAAKKGAPKRVPGFKNDVKAWADDIKGNAELRAYRAEIKLREGAEKLKEKLQERGGDLKNKLREGAGELGERLRGATTNSKDKLKEIASKGLKGLQRLKK